LGIFSKKKKNLGTHAAPTILTNKKTLRFTNLSTAFAKLATKGSKSDENYWGLSISTLVLKQNGDFALFF
jgi:hypothetical protein